MVVHVLRQGCRLDDLGAISGSLILQATKEGGQSVWSKCFGPVALWSTHLRA